MKKTLRRVMNRIRAVKSDPMRRRDVTIGPIGGAAIVAKSQTNRKGAERCAETIRHRETTRSRERCAEPIRRDETTHRDVRIRLSGHGETGAQHLRMRRRV